VPIFRTRGRIRREAADWVVRLGADAAPLTNNEFRQWYEADARHADAYARIANIYSAAGQSLQSEHAQASRARRAIPRRPLLGYAMAAALVGALALLSVLLFTASWRPGAKEPVDQTLAFATSTGEIRQLRLPDGSHLVLDTGSRLEARFGSADRQLTLLEGRARFDVAHEARPFIVTAASRNVIATGTVFDVSLIDGRLAVLLIEGSVEVRRSSRSSSNDLHRLQAMEQLVVGPEAQAVRQAARRSDTLWPTRMLEFDDTPLEDAVAQMNRYSRIPLTLGDEATRRLRISGAYRAGDIAGFAKGLAAAFGLDLAKQPDGSLSLRQAAPRR
jgi:transmembrane sensor